MHGKNVKPDQMSHCGLPSIAMAVSQAKMVEKILKTNKRAAPAVTDEALDKLKMDAQQAEAKISELEKQKTNLEQLLIEVL